MISLHIILILFWHYQKLSQLDWGVQNIGWHFDPHQIIDDKVLFAFHIHFIRSSNISISYELFLE